MRYNHFNVLEHQQICLKWNFYINNKLGENWGECEYMGHEAGVLPTASNSCGSLYPQWKVLILKLLTLTKATAVICPWITTHHLTWVFTDTCSRRTNSMIYTPTFDYTPVRPNKSEIIHIDRTMFFVCPVGLWLFLVACHKVRSQHYTVGCQTSKVYKGQMYELGCEIIRKYDL